MWEVGVEQEGSFRLLETAGPKCPQIRLMETSVNPKSVGEVCDAVPTCLTSGFFHGHFLEVWPGASHLWEAE